MKFSELPLSSYFVVIQPEKETPLLAKGADGQVRTGPGWNLIKTNVGPDTEVQLVVK